MSLTTEAEIEEAYEQSRLQFKEIKGPDNPTCVFRLLAKSLEGNKSSERVKE